MTIKYYNSSEKSFWLWNNLLYETLNFHLRIFEICVIVSVIYFVCLVHTIRWTFIPVSNTDTVKIDELLRKKVQFHYYIYVTYILLFFIIDSSIATWFYSSLFCILLSLIQNIMWLRLRKYAYWSKQTYVWFLYIDLVSRYVSFVYQLNMFIYRLTSFIMSYTPKVLVRSYFSLICYIYILGFTVYDKLFDWLF